MRIGIFDSGIGGLIIARAIRKLMPEYDYVYLGDTKRVPYGNRSHATVYQFTKEGVAYLFEKEKCGLVIIACNTASARALRKIQKEFKQKVLGVLIPAAEEAGKYERIGVLATTGTVASQSFPIEIHKINSKAKIYQNAAPLLVPIAESGEMEQAMPLLKKYLKHFEKKNLDALVLGCTHYPLFKKEIKKLVNRNTRIISQDEIIPKKLRDYLARHTEIRSKLSRKGSTKILVTDKTPNIEKLTKKWFGKNTKSSLVKI